MLKLNLFGFLRSENLWEKKDKWKKRIKEKDKVLDCVKATSIKNVKYFYFVILFWLLFGRVANRYTLSIVHVQICRVHSNCGKVTVIRPQWNIWINSRNLSASRALNICAPCLTYSFLKILPVYTVAILNQAENWKL